MNTTNTGRNYSKRCSALAALVAVAACGGYSKETVSLYRDHVGMRVPNQQRLLALRDELLGKGPSRIEPNRTDDATAGVADEDAQALSEMHQVLASKRNQGQADLLARVGRAIERMTVDPDLFGLCEDCEEEIPYGRLEAVPYATLCAACQAKRDPTRGARRRSAGDLG